MVAGWLSSLGSVLNTVGSLAQATAPLWSQYLPQPRGRTGGPTQPAPPPVPVLIPPGIMMNGGFGSGLVPAPRGPAGPGRPVPIPTPGEAWSIGREVADWLEPGPYRSRRTGRRDQPIPPLGPAPWVGSRARTTDVFGDGTGGLTRMANGGYSDYLLANYSSCAPRTRTYRRRSLYLALDADGNACWRKRRYMNPLNIRALRRAVRRAKSFERIARSVVRLNVSKRFKPSRSKKGCCK